MHFYVVLFYFSTCFSCIFDTIYVMLMHTLLLFYSIYLFCSTTTFSYHLFIAHIFPTYLPAVYLHIPPATTFATCHFYLLPTCTFTTYLPAAA